MWYLSIIKVKKLAVYFLIMVLMKKESIYTHKNTTIVEEIPTDRDIVVYCRSGVRSAMVVKFLENSGDYNNELYNLSGGIHLWSNTVDSSIPKY